MHLEARVAFAVLIDFLLFRPGEIFGVKAEPERVQGMKTDRFRTAARVL